MAKAERRPLTVVEVKALTEPGLHWVDDGLYLQIRGGRSWAHRYMFDGKPRLSGLGSADEVTLAAARAARDDERALIRRGVDPVVARRAGKAESLVEQVKAITFRECAEAYIKAHEATWKNAVHRQQWTNTLKTYVYPTIGALPVGDVDNALAIKIIEPIWGEKPETTSRIRGRCECIIDWAKAREYRGGENPFRWRGHLDKLLPAKGKVRKVKHHTAMPYDKMPWFMTVLRCRDGFAARALEFVLLTVGRTGEVLGCRWEEIDLSAKVWTVPAVRMKGGVEHRVPLCGAAVKLLEKMAEVRGTSNYVFQGTRGPLSNMAMLNLLERMGDGNLTVHGFRSTFRDWVGERTNFPRELAEMALSHRTFTDENGRVVGGKVEEAYRRGDMLEKRRWLMEAWAEYCERPVRAAMSETVVPLRAAG